MKSRHLFAVALFLTVSMLHAEIVEKQINFSVSHPLHLIEGSCEQIEIKGLQVKGSGSQAQLAGPFRIELPVLSLNTKNRSRDSHMLEVLGYPQYRSILVEVQSMQAGAEERVYFDGFLTIRGHRQPFRAEAKLHGAPEGTIIEGTTPVSLQAHAIEAPSLLGIAVSDTIMVRFRFVFR